MYAFYRAMSRHDCRPTELTLFERVVEDLEAFVNDQDVFWVGGGSTANLLAVWRLHWSVSLPERRTSAVPCCAVSSRA